MAEKKSFDRGRKKANCFRLCVNHLDIENYVWKTFVLKYFTIIECRWHSGSSSITENDVFHQKESVLLQKFI